MAAQARALTRAGAAVVKRLSIPGTEVVTVSSDHAKQAISQLKGDLSVQWVEPDSIVKAAGATASLLPPRFRVTLNDPSFGLEWAFSNTGQTIDGVAGTAGADSRVRLAWNLASGLDPSTGSGVIVAVVAGGLDESHVDLVNRIASKPGEIADMVAQTVARFGGIDILVNNAGIQHVAPIDEFPPEKWDAIIAINLSASFHTIRAALPHMKKQGWGRIIQIASAHALVASPFKSAYVAAKHGIAGLTKTVAVEVADKHITCNAICPGYVWTPLVAGQIADTAKARGMTEDEVKSKVILAAQPTRQFTTVEQIGGLAVFLCSPSADNMTGTMIPIDGGWTAQ